MSRSLSDAASAPPGPALIADDARMRAAVERAERAARSDATVLLTGESGVGKDVLARHLHAVSRRAAGPFVALNCAAIPETLLEAMLFGVERGAFTGADRAQAGKFEQAQGGTLFLDEVGELPLAMQAKLLRVLQERSIERLGSARSVQVDLRLIAATNRDLSRAVAEGRFREDLYYRLAVFPVPLPPLRERPADILPLAQHFLAHHGAQLGVQGTVALSGEAAAALLAHRWPGNVRELENSVQRALLLCDDGLILPVHLELELPVQPAATVAAAPAPLEAPAMPAAPPPLVPAAFAESRPRNVREAEREHILRVLQQVHGNRREAIAVLGISERALRYKLAAYRTQGLPVTDPPPHAAPAMAMVAPDPRLANALELP